tara:strand:- start:603 stop:875 length:273 start_codon:yes stop_codon:yes gene_type:complete
MDSKEKYINFIVADLVKKTEIDYEQGKIKYPFFLLFLSPSTPIFSSFYLPSYLITSISKYVIERYGIHDNDVDIIWKLYKEKIKEVIDNG